MIKAIVFDMDGVLIDSERPITRIWTELANKYNISNGEKIALDCVGLNRNDTMQVLKQTFNNKVDPEVFLNEVSIRFKKETEISGVLLKPGVEELFAYLSHTSFFLALASSTRKEGIERHLKKYGFYKQFSVITSGDMVIHSKPDPEIYTMTCEKLGVLSQEAYAIEDSYNGIRSAYSAGMKPIMIPDLLLPTKEMEGLIVKKFSNLTLFKEYLKKTT